MSGEGVLALFVLEPELLRAAGPYRRATLLASVAALDAQLREHGTELHIANGPAAQTIAGLARDVEATAIHANADVSPFARRRDHQVDQAAPCAFHQHWGVLTQAPGSVLTQKGTLSRVFTPFWKRWDQTEVTAVPEPGPATFVRHDTGTSLPAGDDPPVPAGPDAAHQRLRSFLDVVDDYPDLRDIPGVDGTSSLSADLHFGTIGPREVIDIVGRTSAGRDAFVRQLAWRDWYAHLLFETPTMATHAMRPEYDRIQWRHDPEGLEAWQHGQTGYPIVDAAMRQLLHTGWMHNRTRMVAGSFLAKHLLIDWREGERWFRRMLADGDMAQNVGNWQWVAGTGPDAAPYFRIFNPTAQSRKFDGDGTYIRRWVPELASLDKGLIHEPAAAGPLELAAAGVVLGDTYPAPIVDHAEARERCLATYKAALG